MVLFVVIAYLALAMAIGVVSARFVKNAKDYALAGRQLGFGLCWAAMFANWFGSETIIGASAEFARGGLGAVVEDPFGSAAAFVVVGLFYVRRLYALNGLTIVDFYAERFGSGVERLAAVVMLTTYVGWIAAQLVAMALILKVLAGLSFTSALLVSALVVTVYTAFGGMWSISINDLIQTIVIIVGLSLLLWFMLQQIDFDVPGLIAEQPEGFFRFWPEPKLDSWLRYIGGFITIALGAIPQQDVFQRLLSASSEKVARASCFTAAVMYLTVGLSPLFLVIMARKAYPELMHARYDEVLLQAVMQHGSLLIPALFYGALMSAIMSSASGGVLAPATIIAENIVRPFIPEMSDVGLLRTMRWSVLAMVVFAVIYALIFRDVYALVAESAEVGLVTLFVPITAGLYWRRADRKGAYLAIILGGLSWVLVRYGLSAALYAPFVGLGVSAVAMVLGSLTLSKATSVA